MFKKNKTKEYSVVVNVNQHTCNSTSAIIKLLETMNIFDISYNRALTSGRFDWNSDAQNAKYRYEFRFDADEEQLNGIVNAIKFSNGYDSSYEIKLYERNAKH